MRINLLAVVVFIALLVIAVPSASASGGLSAKEAERIARRAADRYTEERFGIDGLSSWRASCRVIHRGGAPGYWQTFSCRLRFNGGQCSGSARVSERRLQGYRVRVRCGE